ncbi:MAG: hypothetical protein DHS20C09_20450 [marine bacterium B5-7]|nr:MAG: hypothetical protein DHS20C09_20450 [marine bacterium B5-7]
MNNIKALKRIAATLFCCLISSTALSETVTGIDPRVIESRKVVKEFSGQLIKELKHAMEEGGPLKAIKVCNIEAPDIAAELSDKYEWDIGRTSLKTRNPNNNPDEWELTALQQFEQRMKNGEDITKLEYYETTTEGFRYMKAIPTKDLCLTCHGTAIPETVKAALVELYPEDKAIGFKAGGIRGAFSIIQNK